MASLRPRFELRIHPTWNQVATGTGRISCSGPNLQALPRRRQMDLAQLGEGVHEFEGGEGEDGRGRDGQPPSAPRSDGCYVRDAISCGGGGVASSAVGSGGGEGRAGTEHRHSGSGASATGAEGRMVLVSVDCMQVEMRMMGTQRVITVFSFPPLPQ